MYSSIILEWCVGFHCTSISYSHGSFDFWVFSRPICIQEIFLSMLCKYIDDFLSCPDSHYLYRRPLPNCDELTHRATVLHKEFTWSSMKGILGNNMWGSHYRDGGTRLDQKTNNWSNCHFTKIRISDNGFPIIVKDNCLNDALCISENKRCLNLSVQPNMKKQHVMERQTRQFSLLITWWNDNPSLDISCNIPRPPSSWFQP